MLPKAELQYSRAATSLVRNRAMPTSDQSIPNFPLNGAELKAVCIRHVRELMQKTEADLITAIEDRMSRDVLFAPSPYTHPRVKVSLGFKFQFSNKNLPKTEFTVEAGSTFKESDNSFVSGVNREIEIESPNLERLAAGLPFTKTESVKPKPGDVFPQVVTTEIPVNAADYPQPKPPVDEDTTEFIAADLNVPEHKRIRGSKKKKGVSR